MQVSYLDLNKVLIKHDAYNKNCYSYQKFYEIVFCFYFKHSFFAKVNEKTIKRNLVYFYKI